MYFINTAFDPSLEIAVIDTYINIEKNWVIPNNPIIISALLVPTKVVSVSSCILNSSPPDISKSTIMSIGIKSAGKIHCIRYIGLLKSNLNSFPIYAFPILDFFWLILTFPVFLLFPPYKLPINPLK